MTIDIRLSWAVLAALITATVFGHFWVWGVLFIFWSVQSWVTGSVFLIAPVERRTDPVLYFTVTAMWLLFGVWELAYDLLWRFGIHSLFGVNIYGVT